MFNVWEYGRKKVTNLRASMRTNRPLSRSQSQSQLNGDDAEEKTTDASPSDESNPFSDSTTRPSSPTSSTTSTSSKADAPPRPSSRPTPGKRNSSASTSSNSAAQDAHDAALTPGATATAPPTLPATRVKSPAPAIPTSGAKPPHYGTKPDHSAPSSSNNSGAGSTSTTTAPSSSASLLPSSSSDLPSLPPPSSPPPPSSLPPPSSPPPASRSDEDPIQASVLSRVSNKFGPAVKRKELLHLSAPTTGPGATPSTSSNGASTSISISLRQSSAPGTPAAGVRSGAASTAANEATSITAVSEGASATGLTNGAAVAAAAVSPAAEVVVNGYDELGAVGGAAAETTPSNSAVVAAAALAADARLRREATAAAAAAGSGRSSAISPTTAASSSSSSSGAASSSFTTAPSKPTLPARMNSMRRRSQQGQGDGVETPLSADNAGNNEAVGVEGAAVASKPGKKTPVCEKCGKECESEKSICGSCSKAPQRPKELPPQQQQQQPQQSKKKKEREAKTGSILQEEEKPTAVTATSAKYGMCPRPGCRTLTHPSWRFCCTCSKNLKPFEILGTLAHMDILGKAANAVVKGGGYPEDPAKLQQDAKIEQRLPEDVQTAEELIKSVINGNVAKVVNLMLKGVSANTMDPDGISALNYACWHDRLDIVRILSSFDADLNQRDARGVTALHVACNRSNGEELPAYLVKHGADIQIRGDNGESILHHAAAGGNMEGITFAIRNGVDVNDVDNDGATPLSYAIVCDNVDTLEYLLSNGAELDTRCHKGQTILHRAVQYRKMSSLKFAVDEGLKILDRDVEGRNALAIAHVTNAPSKIFAFLREALRNELDRCSFCEDLPAHMQFLPCGHQYSCDDCCSRWKKCKCGGVIDKKVDVITDDKGESGAIQEDEVKRIETELSRLQMERERFNEEKTCAVCMDRQKAIVFDCGHTTCVDCSIKMRLCHTCRKPIAKKIKFY